MEKLPIGGGKELAGLRVLGPDAAFRPVPDREGDASACVRGGKPNIGKERSARKWRQFGLRGNGSVAGRSPGSWPLIQNGLTTARTTMATIRTVGTSLIIR
jgi:hypothetical protein